MKIQLLATLLAIGMMGTVVSAQPGPRGERKVSDRDDTPYWTEKLDLSAEQKSKVEALRTAHFNATQEQRDQLRQQQARLDDLLNDSDPDTKTIENLVKEMGQAKTDLTLAHVNHRLEVRNLLTDEQKISFDRLTHHQYGRKHGGRHW